MNSRLPLPLRIVEAMVTAALLMGFVFDAKHAGSGIPTAVLMQAGWHAPLRPQGAGDLRRGGVVLPTSVMAFGWAGIPLVDQPKTRVILGTYLRTSLGCLEDWTDCVEGWQLW